MTASNTGIKGISPVDVMKRQELFLTAYDKIGSIRGACEQGYSSGLEQVRCSWFQG